MQTLEVINETEPLLSNTQLLIIILSSSIGLLLLIILFIVLIKKKKKTKKVRVKIDESFIDTLLLGLGGRSNIKEMIIDNGRLKFNIINLKDLSKDHLDKVSQSGVFITGSFVKLLFKYDSLEIKKVLEGKYLK